MTKINIWQCKECGEIAIVIISRRDGENLIFTCYCNNCCKYFDVQIKEKDFFSNLR